MKIKTLLLVVNLCKFPWICPRWKCDIFTDKNAPVLLREAKRPFCKKKGYGNFLLLKNIYPFYWKKKKRKRRIRNGKRSGAVAELYSPPSDLLLSLTIVLKGRVKLYHALTLQMHFRKIIYVVRSANFATEVSVLLALILLYIQWLSWASYCNPHSLKIFTKINARCNHGRIYQIM